MLRMTVDQRWVSLWFGSLLCATLSPQSISLRTVPLSPVSWVVVRTSPLPMFSRQVAYHEAADQLFVHGAGLNFSETWTLQSGKWTKSGSTLSPGRRFDAALCYRDAARDIFLFGGDAGPPSPLWPLSLADTWSWNGVSWQQLAVNGPARAGMGMAYDSERDRVVVFGGVRSTGATLSALNDTWEWNGVRWINIRTPVAPSPRCAPAMTYDPVRRRCVLFGGSDLRPRNDTWVYDGSTWTQLFPQNSPGPRWSSLTWDDARQVAVLVGGFDGSRGFRAGSDQMVATGGLWMSDTWEWDGSAWNQRLKRIQTKRHPVAFYQSVAYDSRRQRSMTVVWDRTTRTCELLSYGPNTPASAGSFGSPCPGSSGTPALYTSTLPWVGFTVTLSLSGAVPGTSAVLTVGQSNTQWLGATLPLTLAPSQCQVYASVDLGFAGRADAQGNAQWTLPLANLPSLVGRSMFLQGYAADPAVALGFVTSNAIDAVLGAK